MSSNPTDALAAQLAQIAETKARCSRFATTSIRTAANGFVITGQVQYIDKETKASLFAENAEGVAPSIEQATSMSLYYHNTGSFTAPVAKDATDTTQTVSDNLATVNSSSIANPTTNMFSSFGAPAASTAASPPLI